MHPRRHDSYEDTDNVLVCPPAVRDLGSGSEHITQQHRLDRQHRPDGHNAIHQQFTDKRNYPDIDGHHVDNDHQQPTIKYSRLSKFGWNPEQHWYTGHLRFFESERDQSEFHGHFLVGRGHRRIQQCQHRAKRCQRQCANRNERFRCER